MSVQEECINSSIIFKKETYRNEKVATAEGQKQRVDDRERVRNVPMTIGKKIAAITGLLNAVTVLINYRTSCMGVATINRPLSNGHRNFIYCR